MGGQTERVPDIEETLLPGVGVRHDFQTAAGERVSVLTHRSGRRELAIYDRDDPDACRAVLRLDRADAYSLGELLGTSQVSETVGAVQQQIEGLAIDWVPLPPTATTVGTTIAQGQFRTRTGASIVAVLRGGTTVPAPGPELAFEAGDVVVAVGTPEGLSELRGLLMS
jgi:TrkA domain protein